MGMPVQIDLRDGDVDPAILDAAFDWLRLVDATFSTYKADSEISRLSRGELTISQCRPEVDEVLTRCARLHEETAGHFSVRATGELDPSGFVKGWAVGRAADILGAAGARNFSINAGGDVVLRGRPAARESWRIGIRHPLRPRKLAAVLAGEDLAIATSGEYERGAHVIDPHTGRPPVGLLSATIVGPDLATADAYATATFAMGDGGPAWAAGLIGYETLCITTDEVMLSSPGLDRYRVS
ncbi:MAG: FAD:protein transferase [Solirubrobacteraceae bacterium]|jgi:thiamine biosynthesis lipoprotein|nr:FAD:protein transferase [Solirubrobacteraceae bacterium]